MLQRGGRGEEYSIDGTSAMRDDITASMHSIWKASASKVDFEIPQNLNASIFFNLSLSLGLIYRRRYSHSGIFPRTLAC
jgi:hypothetical protein